MHHSVCSFVSVKTEHNHEIAHARKIRLGCFRDWHRSVVRHAAYGEKTAHFPVSLLQDHPDINIKFTEFVANLPE